jgi:hypothetical protein
VLLSDAVALPCLPLSLTARRCCAAVAVDSCQAVAHARDGLEYSKHVLKTIVLSLINAVDAEFSSLSVAESDRAAIASMSVECMQQQAHRMLQSFRQFDHVCPALAKRVHSDAVSMVSAWGGAVPPELASGLSRIASTPVAVLRSCTADAILVLTVVSKVCACVRVCVRACMCLCACVWCGGESM